MISKVKQWLKVAGIIIIAAAHGKIFGVIYSVKTRADFDTLLRNAWIFLILFAMLPIASMTIARLRGRNIVRAGAWSLLPFGAIWVMALWVLSSMKGVRFTPDQAIYPGVMSFIAFFIIGTLLSHNYPNRITFRKALMIFSIVLLGLNFAAWAWDIFVPFDPPITIHKAIKNSWEPTTEVEGLEKFSQLKIELGGWSRIAFAMPVNHSVMREETIPQFGLFQCGVGITKGKGGYQVSVMGIDETGAKYKIGVWYFKRDRSRWEDIIADLKELRQKKLKIAIQVASWNPDGGKYKDSDFSYVYFSNPRIVSGINTMIQNSSNSASQVKTGPGIVVILIDTLRRDRLAVYGSQTNLTPNIDAFAREATVFEDAYSVTSWTMPAIASLFTGKTPTGHGLIDFKTMPLDSNLKTLAEVFAENGYSTQAVFGNPYIGHGTGFDQGFDKFAQAPLYNFHYGNVEWTKKMALEALDKIGSSTFTYIHFFDPHDPYLATGNRRPGRSLTQMLFKPLSFIATSTYYNKRDDGPFRYTTMAPYIKRAMEANYDNEIAAVDDAVGEILKRISPDTTVVILSDHGEEFREHGGIIHGRTLYNECIRIPLIIRKGEYYSDGYFPKHWVFDRVSITGLASTILDFTGIQERLDGVSFKPLIFGEPRQPEPVFADLWERVEGDGRIRTVVYGNRKLILTERRDGYKKAELYLLDEDPGETRDRSAEMPDAVHDLEMLLGEAPWPAPKKYDPSTIDPSLRGKLKTLGYLP